MESANPSRVGLGLCGLHRQRLVHHAGEINGGCVAVEVDKAFGDIQGRDAAAQSSHIGD